MSAATSRTATSTATRARDARGPRRDHRVPARPGATAVLLLGAAYCLVPVAWVLIAASKSSGELFSSFTFAPGTGLLDNLADLFEYQGGQFFTWMLNSALYSGVGGMLSTLVSAMSGFALARYQFRLRKVLFSAFLVGILIPGITLAVPQYLLMSKLGLAGTPWSVLLPVIISPFGIYLCYVFAQGAISPEMLEAARIDGAGEMRIFRTIVLPLMVPGLVTVFLLTFVGIWNNFLLPFIMLSDQNHYPLTLGLYTLLTKGSGQPALYTLAIAGAAVSIIPLVALVMVLQRYWRLDLVSGGVKG